MVAFAGGDLGGQQHAPDAAVQLEKHYRIVVGSATCHHGAQVGEQALHLQAGHVAHEVVCVRPDVPQDGGRPPAPRIGPPLRLLVSLRFEQLRQPPLRVLRHHLAHLADAAASHPRARLLDQRVAGVVVGHREDEAGRRGQAAQVVGLLHGHRQRLVADDVNAPLQKGARHRMVQVVRGDDHHRVDALIGREGRLRLHHLPPGPVYAICCQPQLRAGLPRLLRVRRKGARAQPPFAVEGGRHPVHRADEGARSSSDHAVAEGQGHLMPRRRSAAPGIRPPVGRAPATRRRSP